MDLKRFFVPDKIVGDKIVLENEEFYHAVKVTRHKVGYLIIVCDNTNYDYYAKITEINKDNLVAKVEKKEINIAESVKNITLYAGINKDIDVTVQKAVELGVTRIVPFTSQHGNIAKVNYDRLIKIILESSKQCGRSKLASLGKVVTFEQAIDDAKDSNIMLFYEHERQKMVLDTDIDNDKDIAIFIGSEGGFAKQEIDFAIKNNAKILTLGKRILRVSTAVVAGITLCMTLIGEM
ncbi:MAG: 16S rRNA (uracil(1498)-N(3))-methyltransferase [Clostridiales bacterium]|nr:16S rRNA (uracil(1498)-N(3))-methyltransferase [Clostridiales bacterium]